MRTHYHEFESLEHLLATRLLPGGSNEPIRFVVFGGTGAVGGAVVLELCRLIVRSSRFRSEPLSGEIYATGRSDRDIARFANRLFLDLGSEAPIEKIELLRHYRVGDAIDLRFSLLDLELPHDLAKRAREKAPDDGGTEGSDLEHGLDAYFSAQRQPFLSFVQGLETDLLHAVVVAIPLPSVATYTLEIVERLAAEHGLDHTARTRIKSRYLHRFIHGLAVIQQRYARHVVMAHTTAVGGMYRVDGGGQAEIRLGFAHSALGKKLVEKKHFADKLCEVYLDHGFDVLVTAAAIGIDAVEFRRHLPLGRAVRATLSARTSGAQKVVPTEDLESDAILLYPSAVVDLEAEPAQPIDFGHGKELIVDAAIRSGENGLFSVANCIALYNVMKVAIPEELAMIVVRHAVFGPERRRDWFHDKICYYGSTENALFALRLLENDPQLTRAHHGAFSVQAYQALGSATHQARLHELGLLILLLRLRDLSVRFAHIPEQELAEATGDLDAFFWHQTRLPAFEDLDDLDVPTLGQIFGRLCETETKEDAGALLGFDDRQQGAGEKGRDKFLSRLAVRIQRYLCTITSLGTPIVYRSPTTGRDRIRVGPYVAPMELAMTSADAMQHAWRRLADAHRISASTARNWTIVNNGFVDLRPQAFACCATDACRDLDIHLQAFDDPDAILEWIHGQPVGSYFTTSGLLAFRLRLERLGKQVRGRRIELGTAETWKHLFQQDTEGRHVLSPGLVETVRMYNEGLGKVTGTEALWPSWGY